MLKTLVFTYLVIGMLLIGGAEGEKLKRCPNSVYEPIDGIQFIAAAAAWPMLLLAALVARDEIKDMPKLCFDAPQPAATPDRSESPHPPASR